LKEARNLKSSEFCKKPAGEKQHAPRYPISPKGKAQENFCKGLRTKGRWEPRERQGRKFLGGGAKRKTNNKNGRAGASHRGER